MALQSIDPSQLRIGLFIQLDLPWLKHNFVLSAFKIKTEKQLMELRRLGLQQIQYDPDRSDVEPLEPGTVELAPATSNEALEQAKKLREEKKVRILKLREKRVRLNACENAYAKTVGAVRKLMQNLRSQPAAAVAAANEMVSGMVTELVDNPDATIHLINMKGKNESSYYHSINVTILSLLLGRYLDLDKEQLRLLGVGALLHDLGHTMVPDKILRKMEPLTKAEQDLFMLHPAYGVKLAQRLGSVPPEAMAIIGQHHEMVDGSGYPRGLKAGQITELSKIVAIVNAYDNLCNNLDPQKSRSPYEAMSLLYAKEKQRFDKDKLTVFISKMGVYPPGTVVRLSNSALAVVTSINPKSLLNPSVIIYDPKIPKTEALIVDLQEEDLGIVESVRRGSLSNEVMEYLNLSDNVNYFYEGQSPQRR